MSSGKLNVRAFLVVVGVFYGLSVLLFVAFILPSPLSIDLSLGKSGYLAAALSLLLLMPLYLWYRRRKVQGKIELCVETRRRIWAFCFLLFGLAMSVRTPFVVHLSQPLEKTPVIFLLVLTLVLVEGYSLQVFGFRFGNFLRQLALGVFLFLASLLLLVAAGIGLIYALVGVNVFSSFDPLIFLLTLPFFTFAVGISEEGLFRGYIQTKLGSIMSVRRAILVQAILFGLWHTVWHLNPLDFGGMLFHVAETFLFGLLTGAYFAYARSLTGLVFLHGLTDSFGASIAADFSKVSDQLLAPIALTGAATYVVVILLLSLTARRVCGFLGAPLKS